MGVSRRVASRRVVLCRAGCGEFPGPNRVLETSGVANGQHAVSTEFMRLNRVPEGTVVASG
ncbi:hypothetical protein PPGU19_053440 [Paraburkholderia sp. PGU19]|nr:hypothetical protein PPGU19_053440 [Paraburkholderia sp. PGU19]